jgi:hypothetical protein
MLFVHPIAKWAVPQGEGRSKVELKTITFPPSTANNGNDELEGVDQFRAKVTFAQLSLTRPATAASPIINVRHSREVN